MATTSIKRWVAAGLIDCDRDERNRRIFSAEHVERCQELAKLGVKAQIQQRKLSDVVADQPQQLQLLSERLPKRKRH